jgi:hypothetical protein
MKQRLNNLNLHAILLLVKKSILRGLMRKLMIYLNQMNNKLKKIKEVVSLLKESNLVGWMHSFLKHLL